LAEEESPSIEEESIADVAGESVVAKRERSLHEQRIDAVVDVLKASGAKRVLDLGCGEGKLLRQLLAAKQFAEIVGMDVSIRSLEIAHRRLRLDRLPEMQRERIRLIHGSK
jgi:cyclopropane fatty-acyl-phospholipid synthase-like methyltransferase